MMPPESVPGQGGKAIAVSTYTRPQASPVRGIVLMAAAALFFSLSFSFVRYLSDYISTFEILFLRQVLGMVFMLPWLAKVGISALRTTRIRIHGLRAVCGYGGMLAGYFALVLIPMADTVALQFTLPIFTAILAILFLGERVGINRWAAIFAGFCGVLVIIRPGFSEVNIGMAVALASAALYAATDVSARSLSQHDSTPVIMFYAYILQLPLATLPAIWTWTTPALAQIPAVLGFVLTAMAAQWCLTKSFSLAEASLVSPVLFLRLPFVAILGYVVFGQVSNFWTWVGAAVIFASTLFLAHREAAAQRAKA